MTSIKVPATEKARWFNRADIAGYDFFISFKLGLAPIGAQSYASDLARRLRELDFTVFFSEEEAPAGTKLNTTLVKALHKTRILVVIANEGALAHSQWVRKEVEEFRKKHPKRPIIPINVDRSLEIFGPNVDASKWLDSDGKIWLDETQRAIQDGISSLEVVKGLQVAARFIRANTWFRWAIGVIVLSLSVLMLLFLYYWRDANQKFRDATALRLIAEGSAITSGQRMGGGPIRGIFEVLAGHRLSRSADTDEALQTQFHKFGQQELLWENPGPVVEIAFSMDGKRIVSGGIDGSLHLWDAATGNPIGQKLEAHKDRILSIVLSTDGKHIVSHSKDTLMLWNTITNKSLKIDGHYLDSIAISPDGTRIVTGGQYGILLQRDASNGNDIGRLLEGHKDSISSVAYSFNGERIISGSSDGTLRLWDAKTGQSIGQPFQRHQGKVSSAAFSRDGARIVSGSDDRTLRVWDANTGQLIGQPLKGLTEAVTGVAFSSDGARIVSIGVSFDIPLQLWDDNSDKFINQPFQDNHGPSSSVALNPDDMRIHFRGVDWIMRQWDVNTGQPIGPPLQAHSDLFFSTFAIAAATPDTMRMITGDIDGTLRLWHLNSGQSLTGHSQAISSVAFSRDGIRIASSSDDQTISLWEAETGNLIGSPIKVEGWVYSNSVAFPFCKGGPLIIYGVGDGTPRLWDVETRQNVGQPLKGHEYPVHTVAFSPDRVRIAFGSRDGILWLWDTKIGKLIGQPLAGHTEAVSSIFFSPDGSRIASGSYDKTIQLWDAETGTLIGSPIQAQEPVTSVAFSPDGTRIISGNTNNTLILWDVRTRLSIGQPFAGHEDDVTSVAFSPDGTRIVSGSEDNTLRLWDANNGQPIGQPLQGHKDQVSSVAFSPDGKRIVSGSYDTTLRLWPVIEGWADELCKKLTRNMSHKEWREWVSPDIKYIDQCPGLPIPPDEPEAITATTEETQP